MNKADVNKLWLTIRGTVRAFAFFSIILNFILLLIIVYTTDEVYIQTVYKKFIKGMFLDPFFIFYITKFSVIKKIKTGENQNIKSFAFKWSLVLLLGFSLGRILF